MGSDMNMSQQRYFLLMHKLEGIEAALADTKKEVTEIMDIVVKIDELTQVLNGRLIFAGNALLGHSIPGFNETGRKQYNMGLGSTKPDS
jgi:hypothetical protein